MRNLFDPRPKSSRSELFDRVDELEILDKSIGKPLIVVLGIRRIGKTSLVKSFLEPYNGVYVDLRGVVTHVDLYERLSEGLSSGLNKLRRVIEGIRGIKIMGFGVEIKWRGTDSISLLGFLEELNRRGQFIVVLDEVQDTRPPVSAELRRVLAYTYDHLSNITVILSGSEVRLLSDFMGINNPESSLYGRYFVEVDVRRFTRDESLDFLRLGFKQEGVEPPVDVLEDAVEFFDGIPGWLVQFGRSYIDGGVRDIGAIKEQAISMALSELLRLSQRERMVLRAIAEGAKTWGGQVRRFVEERLGVSIPKSSLTRIINKLESLSIIKDYEFLDGIYREAAKRL
ncbi:ATP-binding protein [Vulcanisaeta distributa]|uniref:AAA family ATPase n=1 Tax=Vulcanisaeta distributa TaxID=164451 RepID=UPI0006D284B3|nr:ATP-binding protein [Vulcanisaeta distributa]